jgi:hypothetical protein
MEKILLCNNKFLKFFLQFSRSFEKKKKKRRGQKIGQGRKRKKRDPFDTYKDM